MGSHAHFSLLNHLMGTERAEPPFQYCVHRCICITEAVHSDKPHLLESTLTTTLLEMTQLMSDLMIME